MKFRLFLIIALILSVFVSLSAYAENQIDLSYKILESRSDGNLLSLKVKLRVKNRSSEPMYDVIVKLNDTSNISVDKNEIYVGKIDSYNTKLSDDIFNITISIPSDPQEKPQAYTEWIVQYIDINGRIVTKQLTL